MRFVSIQQHQARDRIFLGLVQLSQFICIKLGLNDFILLF